MEYIAILFKFDGASLRYIINKLDIFECHYNLIEQKIAEMILLPKELLHVSYTGSPLIIVGINFYNE